MRLFLTLALIAACGSTQDNEPTEATTAAAKPIEEGPPPAAEEPPATQRAAAMSDAEIAAFLGNSHRGEIELGNLAIQTTRNKDVKALAEMIVKDHTAADQKAKDVLGKAGIAPQENEAAKAQTARAQEIMTNLKALEGAAFDRAYVDSQVEMHQQVLDAIDQSLMPSAQSPALKQLMTEGRPGLEKHLEHCKQVQATLAAK